MKEAKIGEMKVTYIEELVFLKFNGVEEELILKTDTIKKLNDLVNNFSKQIVSGMMFIDDVAKLYGETIKCKKISTDGKCDWVEVEAKVNADLLKDIERGSVKDIYR